MDIVVMVLYRGDWHMVARWDDGAIHVPLHISRWNSSGPGTLLLKDRFLINGGIEAVCILYMSNENTNLMQHCAGFISAGSLYMFRAQAPIIRSI